MTKHTGILVPWSDIGTEGEVYWAVIVDQPSDKQVVFIEDNDVLTIYDTDDSVLFGGVIQKHIMGLDIIMEVGFRNPTQWHPAGLDPKEWLKLLYHDPPYNVALETQQMS